MAKQDKNKIDENTSPLAFSKKPKNIVVTNSIISIILFVTGIFILLASFNSAGNAGEVFFKILSEVFGFLAYFIWIIFLLLGYRYWFREKYNSKLNSISFLTIILMIFSLTTFTASLGINFSGIVGEMLNQLLRKAFGDILPSIISVAVFLISFIIFYEDRPKIKIKPEKISKLNNYVSETATTAKKTSKNIFIKIWRFILSIFSSNKQKHKENTLELKNETYIDTDDENTSLHSELMSNISKKEMLESNNENEYLEEKINKNNLNPKSIPVAKKISSEELSKFEEKVAKSIEAETKPVTIEEKFIPPDLNLLNEDTGKSSAGDSKFKMNVIQKVLDQFNIPVEMGEVTVGPSVTQFTLKPAQGVNVRKILTLKDNLQMALSATNMHIEAPIPGKPFIGVEIPNEKKTRLGLRSLLEIEEFQNGPALALAIGKDIIGKPIISNLSKMPHLLVAGATGTGKSVTLHNLILSLLYKNSPYDLKLIILDPKRVEFNTYNSLPHLYTPIIKDVKTAIKTLNWAAQEMDRRYDVLGEYGMPNLHDYNQKVFEPAYEKAKKRSTDGDIVTNLPPKMPFIVIVFDEFNDFMLSYPKEITPIITSLTQKARAAGIHLILTTQRPDVKVITGTIKANIPSRIALKTTSQVDSRTILDQAGAEDLLGNGDMLYMNGSKITRVQAPFVSSEEISSVIKDIKKKYDDFIPDIIDLKNVKTTSLTNGFKELGEERNKEEEPTDDEDYMSARDYVISTNKASTSALQTAFRWGYNKAARIMNDLEQYGIISANTNGRYREVLFGKNSESDVERLEREIDELKTEKNENDIENKEI